MVDLISKSSKLLMPAVAKGLHLRSKRPRTMEDSGTCRSVPHCAETNKYKTKIYVGASTLRLTLNLISGGSHGGWCVEVKPALVPAHGTRGTSHFRSDSE